VLQAALADPFSLLGRLERHVGAGFRSYFGGTSGATARRDR
jgi:hypothetical protein